MIPGGSLGAHIAEHAKLGVAAPGSGWSYDGTYWNLKISGTTVARIDSSGNLLIAGDFKAQQSF